MSSGTAARGHLSSPSRLLGPSPEAAALDSSHSVLKLPPFGVASELVEPVGGNSKARQKHSEPQAHLSDGA